MARWGPRARPRSAAHLILSESPVVSENNRNMFYAIGLSLLVLVVWQRFIAPRTMPKPAVQQTTSQAGVTTPDLGAVTVAEVPKPATTAQAIAKSPRVTIKTPALSGSINLQGAQFDDLVLVQHKETTDKNSPSVQLLHPAGTREVYFASFGWTKKPDSTLAIPGAGTLWQATAAELTPQKPVTLFWDNGTGQRFEMDIAVDDKYLFTVTQRVRNTSVAQVALNPYGTIYRIKPDNPSITSASHEGIVGVFNTLEETKYSAMADEEDRRAEYSAPAAWLGFTDKYWLTAILPDPKLTVTGRVVNLGLQSDNHEHFKSDVIMPSVTTPPGKVTQTVSHLFAGAKEVAVVDAYDKKLGAKNFWKAIDWGWFYFFTRPFFKILHFLYGIFGNFGLAIIGLTVIVKALFFPIANKQYESFARMKIIQPKVKELQEKYKEDRMKMQTEMMALYKKEKVNPLGGCLPIVLQIPVFYAVYKVIFVALEMRHQPFFGWIKDLSVADPLTPFNLFGLLPFIPPSFGLFTLAVGVLPLILGVTMWLQQKMQPMTGVDPAQQAVFKFMPIIFTFMMAPFAVGVVIYWITNNLLSIAQQKFIQNRIEKKLAAGPVAEAK
jgi:YidC/Oxa1 family membrane protein insertase